MNIFRLRLAFVGVVSIAKLLVQGVPSHRTPCYAYDTAEAIPVLGQMEVQVNYGEYTGRHKLHVVRGKEPPLLGRDWLEHFHCSVCILSASCSTSVVEELT